LTPVYLRIAGREIVFKVSALSDGTETYVPLEILSSLGATGQINRRGDSITVTLLQTRQHAELALARPEGTFMLVLSDLARLLNAEVRRPDKLDQNGKPLVGTPGDTVYLLARVTDVRSEDGALRVTTSFPVPFHVRMLHTTSPSRGYIDCVGASVAPDFHPASLPAAEKRILGLRANQYSEEVARIAVDLAAQTGLHGLDVEQNMQPMILARLEAVAAPAAPPTPPASQTATHPAPPAQTASQPMPHPDAPAHADMPTSPDKTGTPGTVLMPSVPATRNQPDARNVSPPNSAANQTIPTAPALGSRQTKPWRGGQIERPFTVRALTLLPQSDTQVRLEITTTGKASPFIHYLRGTSQMVMDIPNAILDLTAAGDSDQTLTHPMVQALHAEMVQNTPPMVRVTLDMTRIVGFTVDSDNGKLTLDLRLPRNATGVLADKLIVVDAGHGGSSSGADGHGAEGVVLEKNITLAIALKLRAALEACGARVVMTRDRDVAVPLYDRPRLANSIGADLFISIHNDSNGTPNTASGTSTYYHKGDPSSRALAICVQDAVSAVTDLPSRGALSDGILYASGLAVLRESRMPAVLCEVAYINNAHDRRKLVDPDFQQRVAQAMCDGLRHYVEGMQHVALLQPGELGE
jgi:N-acetylmuramoyl-L-alanine amidase